MSSIHYGCQTYPWKMNKAKYIGDMRHIIATTAKAGFEGIEAEIDMLGDYFNQPQQLQELLSMHGIAFSTLVLHQPWQHMQETEEEYAMTQKAISFLSCFPHAKMMVSHHAGSETRPDGAALTQRRQCLISCMDGVANRAAEHGIVTCFHPNSATHSLFKTRDDYTVMFEMLAKTDLGWAPDIGHIVNGGINPLEILQYGRSKIRHVHFKDRTAQNEWAVMGRGSIEYPAVIQYLQSTGYGGWIVVEDESPDALQDSDKVVMLDGAYIATYQNKGGN